MPQLDLKPWQRQRLEEAAKLSKKKTSVKRLAGDLQLSREEVTAFLNWWRPLSEDMKESFKEASHAADQALQERMEIVQHGIDKKPKSMHFQEVNEIRNEQKSRKQRITSRHEAILEKIFTDETRRPSDELISEVSRLQGLNKASVSQWFEDKRSRAR